MHIGKMGETYVIEERISILRKNAAKRWNVEEQDCHIGHLALQGMLQEPEKFCQIDGATGDKETNLSVATRTIKLACAMTNYGLKTGDTVVVMGINHLDLCIPYFACHANGYAMCAIDPMGAGDLSKIWPYIHPKMIFCQKSSEDKVKEAFEMNGQKCKVVLFDDKKADLESFIDKYGGYEINYRPAVFDQSKTTAWLILTSGTTGIPKVAVIPFETLLNGIICWWTPSPQKIDIVLAMATLQWISSLIFFIVGPLKSYTRLQSSAPASPQGLLALINNYKPNVTAWTPYLLGKFLVAAENVCDLSSFKVIIIGGSGIEKPLLDRFRKQCSGRIDLVYGMSELLVPVFVFTDKTPYGASGKPFYDRYQYKLVGVDGRTVENHNENGELWIKGKDFFTGYKNNPEETSHILSKDGWVMTGDMFYKDEQGYYFFVERKRLLIKHYGFLISPLHMEEVIKRNPSVAEACVVSLPMPEYMELPIAAILRRNGDKVDFRELFDLMNNNVAAGRQLSTGFFFIDSFPVTPSGKLHRVKVKEIAAQSQWTIFHRQN